MIYLKLTSLFTRRGFIRRLAALTGAGVSSVWHGPALAQVPQGHPRPGTPPSPSPPPADLSISLDFGSGNIATFAGAHATDMSDFVGEFVRQKCYLATNANYPDWRVFFRVDADRRGNRIIAPAAGWRDEVVVEYGRTTHGTPTNIPRSTPYTATVTKAASTVYSVSVPGHWWYARWRWKSSERPVVRSISTLKTRGWIPNFTSAGLFGLTAASGVATWSGPMSAPSHPNIDAFSQAMAAGGDNDAIGLTTEAAAQYAIFGTASLLTTVLLEGEWSSGNWATHYRDDTTGAPIDAVTGSKRFVVDGGTINDLPGARVTIPEGSEPGYVYLDAAHMYASPSMPWMLTDDPYFLEGLHGAIDWVMLDQPSTQYPGLMRIDQTRGYAWGLRDLFLAVKTTPTTTPLWLRNKAYWQTALTNNLTYSMRYVTGPSRLSTIFKTWTITSFDGSWQTSWLNSEVGQGVLMGFSEWAPVFNWAIDGHIQMTNGTSGWPRQWPAPYYWFPQKNGGAVSIQIWDLTGATDATNATSWADAWAYYKSGGSGTALSDLTGVPIDSYGGGPQSGWDTTTLYQKYGHLGIGTLTQSHICALRSELAIAVSNEVAGAQACYDWIHSKTIELFAHAGGVGEARFSVSPIPPNTSPLHNLVAGKVRNLGPYANASVSGGESITEYSGTVADSTAKRILTNGGGHGPCMETDIRAFDLQTLTWSSLYPSTAYSAMTLANMDQTKGRFVADNKPYARHTYGMLAISGRKLYCMQAQGMPYHPVGSPDSASISEAQWGGRIWWYDFNTETHGYSANATVPWYNAGAAIADPISGKIVVSGTDPRGSGIAMAWLYDTTNDTIREIHNGGFTIGVYENKMFYDSAADRFISISNTGTGAPVVSELTLNRANPTASTFVKVTPTGQAPNSFSTAFGWDNTNRRAGGGIVNGLFYLYDATSRTWSRQQMVKETGGSATMTLGGYGCEFDPTSGCYIFLAYWQGVYDASNIDGNTYAYRPT